MSATSSFDRIVSEYGGIARLLLRRNATNASAAIGSGASLGPVTPPCPSVPWHCQQPCCMKATLPFSAEAANAPPQPSKRPAANATGPRTRTKRIDETSLARLRPDIEQRRLPGLHHGHRLLERRAELGRILDRTLGPPAHGFRELVVLDVRV